MAGTLIFVIVVALAAAAVIGAVSFVGTRRRAQGSRLDDQVKAFRHH
jgi:hypothetical protein